MLELARVQHKITIAYDHHANGLVERANRNIRSTIEKMIRDGAEEERRNRWHELVPDVQHAMNNRVHRVTQTTPFSLMFGRESYFGYNRGISDVSLSEARNLRRQFWQIFNKEVPKAALKMRQAAANIDHYPHKTGKFQIGEWVVARLHGNNKGDDKYSGEPLQIVSVDEDGIYTLRNGGLTRKEPANHLKRAAEPDSVKLDRLPKEVEEEELEAELDSYLEGKMNGRRSRRVKRKIDYVKLNGGVIGVDDRRDMSFVA